MLLDGKNNKNKKKHHTEKPPPQAHKEEKKRGDITHTISEQCYRHHQIDKKNYLHSISV